MIDPNYIVHTGGEWVPPRKVVINDLYTSDPHFVRYVLFRTPWGGVQLHKFLRPDNDRHLHNHPRVFWTLILRGGYAEERRSVTGWASWMRRWLVGSVHKMPLNERHKIVRLLRVPTWTLVVVGPKKQEWGFFTEDGFVLADDYPKYLSGRVTGCD